MGDSKRSATGAGDATSGTAAETDESGPETGDTGPNTDGSAPDTGVPGPETDEPNSRTDGNDSTTAGSSAEHAGTVHATDRWRGITAVTFLAGGLGVLLGRPSVLLVGVLGLAYALYARLWTPPPASIRIERSVADSAPSPGEDVEVTLTVTNDGERWLPDVRVLDGVPETLSVSRGDARVLTSLAPGGSTSTTYAVAAARGSHGFDPAIVVVRDPSGAIEHRSVAAPRTATTVTCVPDFGAGLSPTLRNQTVTNTGVLRSASTGHGIEFHSVREYQPGDALSRIDWRHLARTGEPATVAHHAERMATIVLLVDARAGSYRVPRPGEPNAVERSIAAARAMTHALLRDGNQVGIAVLGGRFGWLGPSLGRDHRVRARRFLALDPSLAPTPPEDAFLPRQLRTLWARLPGDAQVVYLSPLLDRFAESFPRRMEARGHLVSVVSPDVTARDTPGRSLAAIERDNRADAIRRADIPVVDWPAEESLATAIQAARRRWSR